MASNSMVKPQELPQTQVLSEPVRGIRQLLDQLDKDGLGTEFQIEPLGKRTARFNSKQVKGVYSLDLSAFEQHLRVAQEDCDGFREELTNSAISYATQLSDEFLQRLNLLKTKEKLEPEAGTFDELRGIIGAMNDRTVARSLELTLDELDASSEEEQSGRHEEILSKMKTNRTELRKKLSDIEAAHKKAEQHAIATNLSFLEKILRQTVKAKKIGEPAREYAVRKYPEGHYFAGMPYACTEDGMRVNCTTLPNELDEKTIVDLLALPNKEKLKAGTLKRDGSYILEVAGQADGVKLYPRICIAVAAGQLEALIKELWQAERTAREQGNSEEAELFSRCRPYLKTIEKAGLYAGPLNYMRAALDLTEVIETPREVFAAGQKTYEQLKANLAARGGKLSGIAVATLDGKSFLYAGNGLGQFAKEEIDSALANALYLLLQEREGASAVGAVGWGIGH